MQSTEYHSYAVQLFHSCLHLWETAYLKMCHKNKNKKNQTVIFDARLCSAMNCTVLWDVPG